MIALVRIACRPHCSPITSRPDLAFVPFAAGADTFGAVLAIKLQPNGATSLLWVLWSLLYSSGEPQHDSTENRRPRHGQQRDQLS